MRRRPVLRLPNGGASEAFHVRALRRSPGRGASSFVVPTHQSERGAATMFHPAETVRSRGQERIGSRSATLPDCLRSLNASRAWAPGVRRSSPCRRASVTLLLALGVGICGLAGDAIRAEEFEWDPFIGTGWFNVFPFVPPAFIPCPADPAAPLVANNWGESNWGCPPSFSGSDDEVDLGDNVVVLELLPATIKSLESGESSDFRC
jgi:hypothetical protein